MTDAKLFVEGGGDSHEQRTRCREGFRKLLEECKFSKRLPRIVACGSRDEAYTSFKIEHLAGKIAYVALLVDSEDPVLDDEETWSHLKSRDGWDHPDEAENDQVFLMTTCMETWIVADHEGLKQFFEKHKPCLRPAGLPPSINLQARHRHTVQEALTVATKDCTNAYAKNQRSFDALAHVSPTALRPLLPAFDRMLRILDNKLR